MKTKQTNLMRREEKRHERKDFFKKKRRRKKEWIEHEKKWVLRNKIERKD